MFNCDVSQTLSAINSAADSIKIISTDLWVFLTGDLSTSKKKIHGNLLFSSLSIHRFPFLLHFIKKSTRNLLLQVKLPPFLNSILFNKHK
jgi:hypothetical protein